MRAPASVFFGERRRLGVERPPLRGGEHGIGLVRRVRRIDELPRRVRTVGFPDVLFRCFGEAVVVFPLFRASRRDSRVLIQIILELSKPFRLFFLVEMNPEFQD